MTGMRAGLTPDEDAELRRLHFLGRFGVIATRVARRYDELRHRDRRNTIREPEDTCQNGDVSVTAVAPHAN